MSLENAVTRYVLTDPDNARKLFTAPNVEVLDGYSEATAALWADIYNSHETLAAAKADVDDWVRMLSDKEYVEDDEFNAEEETPDIALARILRNGTVEIYYPAGELPEVAAIPEGLEPGEIRQAEWLLDDFGIPAGMVTPHYGAGPARCEIIARVLDHDGIVDSFEKELADLAGDDLRHMFYPFTKSDTGFTLEEVALSLEGKNMTITLSGQVTDPALMQLTASLAGRESGRDSDYFPKDVGDAIFELNHGANDSAGATDYGLELVEWRTPEADVIAALLAAEDDGPAPGM